MGSACIGEAEIYAGTNDSSTAFWPTVDCKHFKSSQAHRPPHHSELTSLKTKLVARATQTFTDATAAAAAAAASCIYGELYTFLSIG